MRNKIKMELNSLGVAVITVRYNATPSDVTTAPNQSADDTFERFSFVQNVIVCGVLSVVCMACNLLSVAVLQSDRHKLSMTILLQGLALSDSLFLAYTLIYTTLRSIYKRVSHIDIYRCITPYVVTWVLPVGWTAQTCSIWLVTLVAVDRYIYICHPFTAQRQLTVRRARWVVVGTFTAALLFNIPRFFYYHHLSFGDNAALTNSTSTFVSHVDSRGRVDLWYYYRTVYHIGLTLTLLFVIPLPTLIVMNVRLVRAISEARSRQAELTGSKTEQHEQHEKQLGVTINLVVLVTVFVICETPDFVASIVKLAIFGLRPLALDYLLAIKELLLVFNASINFFIYICFYRKFRRLLRAMLCPSDSADNPGSSIMGETRV